MGGGDGLLIDWGLGWGEFRWETYISCICSIISSSRLNYTDQGFLVDCCDSQATFIFNDNLKTTS